MAKGKIKSSFRFRRADRVGSPSAEDDELLHECFVDAGDLEALSDTHNPYRIVVGRTGAGKTALLRKLDELEENVVWLQPDSLSLQYLANNSMIKYLTDNSVDLDLFYKVLWRHIFAVELIKVRYRITSRE
jgi:hypothetical protein